MKIKDFFKNARTRVGEMKIFTGLKTLFNKLFNSKIIKTTTETVKSKTTEATTKTKEFIDKHANITDSVAGNVMHRFQDKIKKWFRDFTKNTNKNSESSKIVNVGRIAIKIICILATIAFIALVIYCIKDVFVYCLMMVATCAAVIACVEFILWVLGTAFGCKV